jgi:hypothetical protein
MAISLERLAASKNPQRRTAPRKAAEIGANSCPNGLYRQRLVEEFGEQSQFVFARLAF